MAEAMEQPLAGGNSNAVVRIGDTVHREAGPWTATVHRLLRHVRANGFGLVPEPIGSDDRGREVLSYLPGTVPAYPMPAWAWDDQVLVEAAAALRRFHDATAGFECADAAWQQPAHPPIEVVCINDVAPYNMVFDDAHRLTGIIDVDQASPGSRAWDLCYLAYRIVPLVAPSNPDVPSSTQDERTRRLALLCATYGGVVPADVLAVLPDRLRAIAASSLLASTERPELAAHARIYLDDAAWVSRTADGTPWTQSVGATIMGGTPPGFARSSTMQVNAYLNFRGDAEAAMTFYQSVLGGEFSLMRFSDIGMPGIPDEQAGWIMHSQIDLDGRTLLMGSDVPSHMDYAAGTNTFSVSISGGPTDVDDLKAKFDLLAEGGTVGSPWSLAPWGDWFGMLKDRYGVSWLVNATGERPE